MEPAVIISIAVIVIIAAVEIYCLFICSKLRGKSYPITAAIPVFPGDEELRDRLSYLDTLLTDGEAYIGRVLLIDCGASPAQLELCRQFCEEFPAAVMTDKEGLENSLRKCLQL